MKKQQIPNSILENKWLPFIVIMSLGIITFGSSIYHGINVDDELVINNIPKKVNFSDIISVFKERYNGSDYRPISVASFFIERWILGRPSILLSHSINLILYILLCFLIYIFYKQLCKEKNNSFIPLITAILFCVHPVHTGVVASLKSRDNILSLIISLISFLVLFKAASSHRYKRIGYTFCSFIILYLATFAKLDSFGFLLVFPIFYYLFIRKNIKEAIGISLLFLLLFLSTRDLFINNITDPVRFASKVTFEENPLVSQPTFSNKISMCFLTLGYYLKFMLFPKGYYFYFGYAILKVLPLNNPLIILSIIIHTTFVILALINLRKNKVLSFCIFGYFICLLYALNLFQPVAGVIADRYVFISSMFFCGCFAFFLLWLKDKLSFYSNEYRLLILTTLCVLINIYFARSRNDDWKSRETLYEADLPYVQKSVNALRMIAEHEITQSSKTSNVTKKQQHLNKAITLCDNALLICDSLSVLYQIKANAQFTLEQKSLAFVTIQTGIDKSYENTGSLATKAEFFARENNLDSAIQYYQKTLLKDTSQAEIFVKMIDLKNKKGLFQESMKESMLLIKDRPHFLAGYQNVANTYLYMGDTLQAVNYFIEAFKRGVENPEMAQGIKEYFINKGMNERLPEIEPYTQ